MKKCFIACLASTLFTVVGWADVKGNTPSPEGAIIVRPMNAIAQTETSPTDVVQAWLEAMVTGDAKIAKSYIIGLPDEVADQVIDGMIRYAKGQPLPMLKGEQIFEDKAIVINANGERIPLRKVDGKWKVDLSVALKEETKMAQLEEVKPGSPMAAMLAFYEAMIAGDIERTKTLVTGTPDTFLADKAAETAFFSALIQDFQSVANGQAQMPTLAGEKINGDTATVLNERGMEFPLPLKKIDGKWKIDLSPLF